MTHYKRSRWEDLRRSLTDRADALMEYADFLLAESSRSDDGFTRALKMCRLYARVFVDVLESDLEGAEDDARREDLAAGHLKEFKERSGYIDRWLSRGSQSAVPRALNTMCRRQFDAAQIAEHEPVLTVGAPESFEAARIPDLHDFLFSGLRSPKRQAEVDALSEGKRLAIISVPYVEGTRTLWYPITVGHELCHVRLEVTHAGEELHRLTDSWIVRDEIENSAVWDAVKKRGRSAMVTLRAALLVWTVELVCDLNAVRLFGPAGLSAISEFISLGEGPERHPFDSTHPPAAVRLEVMRRYLDQLGFSDGADPGEPAPPAPEAYDDPVTAWLVATLIDNADELIAFLDPWGHRLESSPPFEKVLSHCVEELLDGIPCNTHVSLDGEDAWTEITAATVVNAAWRAREELGTARGLGDTNGQDGDSAQAPHKFPRTLATTPGLEPEERRLHVDRLAGKAIDSIELARLLKDDDSNPRAAAHELAQIRAPGDREVDTPLVLSQPAAAGVLSSRGVNDRLALRLPDPQRLVVAPLFSDAIREAAVDLRLGPDFIAFRHSATSAFDPLDPTHDPRMVQGRVTKSWGEQFILHPNELILAATLEYLVIPSDLSGQVITRSSWGRLGLMTATAVQIQPGSRGCITLELQNQGDTPIALWPGIRVAQLVLWSIAEPVAPRPGKYWFPTGPEFSKAHTDPDANRLAEIGRQPRNGRPAPDRPFRARYTGSELGCRGFMDTEMALTKHKSESQSEHSAASFGSDSEHYEFVADRERVVLVLRRWGDRQDRGVEVLRGGDHEDFLLSIRSTEEVEKKEVQFTYPNGGRRSISSADPDALRSELDRFLSDPDHLTLAELPV